jgi:hypothetical protein
MAVSKADKWAVRASREATILTIHRLPVESAAQKKTGGVGPAGRI